jgi:plastocyanin
MLHRRLFVVLAALALLAACSSGPDEPGPNDGASLDFSIKATITIDDRGIDPAVTKARVGDALSVVNRGTTEHGLTSSSIDTGTLEPGESTTVFLTESGTVELRDRADGTHTARIEITAAPGSQ